MYIKEVETLTGITSKNIRFYEKEGLVSPERSVDNRYRQYSEEDVRRLKEIKLLRKFGIGLNEIRNIQNGELPLNECLEMYLGAFNQQKKELEKVIELCQLIQKNETSLQTLDTDYYLNEVASAEEEGARFINITRDFINKAKSILPAHAEIIIEPKEPILNQFDFAKELNLYAEKEGKSITMVKMGMYPKIILGGIAYDCTLEMPKFFNYPLSMFFVYSHNFGYRWIYLYEDKNFTW